MAYIQAQTMKNAPMASDTPNLSPTRNTLTAAANSTSVVKMMDASVAGTSGNAIDSIYSAALVVTSPV